MTMPLKKNSQARKVTSDSGIYTMIRCLHNFDNTCKQKSQWKILVKKTVWIVIISTPNE